MRPNRMVAGAVVALLAAGVTAAIAQGSPRHTATPVAFLRPTTSSTGMPPTSAPTTSTTLPTTTTAMYVAAPPLPELAGPVLPAGPVTQLGCPPPEVGPQPPGPEPWHPAVLVPDSALPAAEPPGPWVSDPRPAFAKGMWVWMWKNTEGGDADAVVRRAVRSGLHQLWVRVGDSQDGFYAAPTLSALVAKAHAARLSVIGWGFPHLYDPVADAAWTNEAMDWHNPNGERLDGFSADIERASEGVMLSGRRAAVYLGAVRRHVGNRLIVATVYPPLDRYWSGGEYPFSAMAPYVDAFAPMIYWECTDPGADAIQAVERLSTLRPVHLIGQAYNMADTPGGRVNAPSAAETLRFLDIGKRAGAIGASFWVWNTMDDAEWGALSSYPWKP